MKKIIGSALGILVIILFSNAPDISAIVKLSFFGMIFICFGDWIGDTFGSATGFKIRLQTITSPSPGWAFVFLGWILIVIAYGVGITEIFIK